MGGRTSYASIKKYEDRVYDKMLLRVKKGQREKIKAFAESRGLSLNAFINQAIAAAMGEDIKKENPDAETSGS